MARKKEGWEIGQGKWSQPAKLTEGRPPEDAKPGKEITEGVWINDERAMRGPRKRSSS
jgi:hypothetical protein